MADPLPAALMWQMARYKYLNDPFPMKQISRLVWPFIRLAGLLISAGAASAANVTINIFEQGKDVIVETTGSFGFLPTRVPSLLFPQPPLIGTNDPNLFQITGDSTPVGVYKALASVNQTWGYGGSVPATSTSGSAFAISGNNYTGSLGPEIFIPKVYTEGSPIMARSVYANTTLAALGFLRSGLLETYTLLDRFGSPTTQTIEVKTPQAPVPSCENDPSYGKLNCELEYTVITVTGSVFTAFRGGTLKVQSGPIKSNSIVPMNVSPEGGFMTYTDQIGDTSDNVVSLLLEAPAGTLLDPEALDINIGISDVQDQIIGAA